MKKILALLFMLFAATAYAIPPMPSGTPPVGTITGLFTGEGDYLKSDGTKGTPSGSGDVVGPAASTQYKIPLWGAADKTLVDGVAVGTEGMILRSAGAGANPAWSAYTLALPGAVGAVLYSDGTNWTRSAAPSLLALTLYGQSSGGGAQIALGSSLGSTDPNDGKMLFRNATNTNTFTVQTGVSGADLSWTLPTAAPGGSNYLLNVDADGTMGYTDPSTFQTADADLTTIAGLSAAQGKIIIGSAAPAWSASAYTLPITDGTENYVLKTNGSGTVSWAADSTGGTPSFDAITNGTNTTATMTVGTGGAIVTSGSGSIKATDLVLSSQSAGDIAYFDGTNWVRLAKDEGKYLKSGASAVSWDTPSGAAHDALTLAGTPETNVFSLSSQELSFDTQTANYIFAGPTTGAAAAPTFRALVTDDIPDLSGTYQPLDSTLTALAGIAITVDGNNVTFPGGVITTAANGSRIVSTLDNTTTLTFLTAGTYGWYFDNGVPYFNINGTGYKSMYEGGSFGGLIFGDSSPDTAGEMGYASGKFLFFGANSEDFYIEVGSASDKVTLGSNTSVSEVNFSALNLVTTGTITGLSATHILTNTKGTHDGDNDAATLSDSGESFTTNQFVGMTLYNITDGSSCTVTANNGTTATCTLTGGTDNNWDTNDAWQVGPGPEQSGSMWLVTAAATIRHPATAGYTAFYMSNGTNKLTVDMASDSMVFKGTVSGSVATLTAGYCIDSSGSTADDFMGIINVSTTSARGLGFRGTWTDGGAD